LNSPHVVCCDGETKLLCQRFGANIMSNRRCNLLRGEQSGSDKRLQENASHLACAEHRYTEASRNVLL
jgi:hypothetical protein